MATLADRLSPTACFLPRILPLGDLDAIETDLLLGTATLDGASKVRPAVDPTARRMVLTRLIMGWAKALGTRPANAKTADDARPPGLGFAVAGTPADAWYLAGELADLFDELTLADLDCRSLAKLGTGTFDKYWALTLDFLKIATEHWPAILASRGLVDPAERRKALFDGEVERLSRLPGETGPVIVAGAVGSDPHTARLLAAIARLPQGAVVLPGLDQALDEASWVLLGAPEGGHGHPQATLHHVLAAIGMPRAAVVPLGTVSNALVARQRLVSEALRPAKTTEHWHKLAQEMPATDLDDAVQTLALIEAADEAEEALALAIILREVLEGEGSAVLVTPDRTLARRVREELIRWDIVIDDSGGEALAATPAGALAQQVLGCLLDDYDPVDMLALLAHAAVRLGRSRPEVDRLTRDAELHLLRGVVPKGALARPDALVAAARERRRHAYAPSSEPAEQRLIDLEALLVDVVEVLAPLRTLGRAPLSAWLATHEAAIAAFTATTRADSALGGADGAGLASLFADLLAHAEDGITLDLAGYAALFRRIVTETTVRGPTRSHPRLKILGLVEFRLLDADRVVLGGLDEGIWPPPVRTDAFLNRPMRASLGLASPEHRITQTAHDFEMALGKSSVVISRAAKRGGSPTVPSRLLQRLGAVAGEARWAACRARGNVYLHHARALDRPEKSIAIGRPSPTPPVDLRPTSLSVTRIETLRRDPYAIYAEKILRLRPLDPIGAAIGPREWGTAFHGVLKSFVDRVRHGPVPAEAVAELLADAQSVFAPLIDEPNTRAFMGPRLGRWVEAFHRWDGERRGHFHDVHVEAEGKLPLTLKDGSQFELTATADRIEWHGSGAIRLVDYKTGSAPSKREVAAGFAPQLTLEAAIALGGGFAALASVAALDEATYVRFNNTREVDQTRLAFKDRSLDDVVTEHLNGLRDLLDGFRDPATGYMARPYPQFAARFSDYDHLSRVKEWSATGGLGDGLGEGGE